MSSIGFDRGGHGIEIFCAHFARMLHSGEATLDCFELFFLQINKRRSLHTLQIERLFCMQRDRIQRQQGWYKCDLAARSICPIPAGLAQTSRREAKA